MKTNLSSLSDDITPTKHSTLDLNRDAPSDSVHKHKSRLRNKIDHLFWKIVINNRKIKGALNKPSVVLICKKSVRVALVLGSVGVFLLIAILLF